MPQQAAILVHKVLDKVKMEYESQMEQEEASKRASSSFEAMQESAKRLRTSK